MKLLNIIFRLAPWLLLLCLIELGGHTIKDYFTYFILAIYLASDDIVEAIKSKKDE